MDELEKIRKEINAADAKLLKALSARRKLSRQVIELKAQKRLPLRDPGREGELLAKLIEKGRGLGLDAHFITRVFHEIIDDSVRSQQIFLLDQDGEGDGLKRVSFQGIEGAYSHLAAQKHFAQSLPRTSFVGYPTFDEVVESVEKGDVDLAFLPIENTTAGSINEVYDLLAETSLSIIGEEVFRVEHCLLATEDLPVSSLRRVYSHPQALAQCMKFLSTLGNCQREYFADTAMAARKIKEDQDPSQAAIASEAAGRQYGLKILKRDLADQRDNYTRFLVVARQPRKVDTRIPAKTSLVLAVPHEEGALLKALMVFHDHKVNLTKLDGSRPRAGAPFQYLFNVDFEGNITEEHVLTALGALRRATSFLKILGSYPVESRTKTKPAIEAIISSGSKAKHKPSEAAKRSEEHPEKMAAAPGSARSTGNFKLSSREAKPEDTVVDVNGVKIGGPEFVVLAGPSLVESKEQVFACARQVKECGGKILRGGCFQPDSERGSLQSLGFEAVELLAEAGREYDLPVSTEVLAPTDVESVATVADILEIGGRGMQNFSLLREVSRINRPIILKRDISSTLEDLLNAAEHILNGGNQQVLLCERGIRTFETRSTLDLGAIPVLKQQSHLPIIVDPSHAAGQRGMVLPLARAAHAVGPHALILEIHPDPETELSEALTFQDFAELMREIYRV